ncbi:MAG: IclR family transcriptional regulator [Galactobacter sp.]|uniref:IclR family transcriptional regulator n=1 Tax=Galactobacter sp. TaxID=2676125 RepID=UPI0025BD8529|nr:IclR family transcriptional regulator [Galactobacter sp.]
MPRSSSESSGPTANRSVVRAIQILRALSASDLPMTATDVAQSVGLPRATVFRLLMTLEEEGFVSRTDTLYSLGWDLARIADSVDPVSTLVPRISGIIEELADELGETVTLSLRRGRYGLDLVAQANPHVIGLEMSQMNGQTWPLHASSTGKLLLAELTEPQVLTATGPELPALTDKTITTQSDLTAELEQIRRQGWAITDRELEDDIVSVAVPIRDSAGTLMAILTWVGLAHRIDAERRRTLTQALIEGAERVRTHLNTTPG